MPNTSAYKRAYYEANKERIKARSRQWSEEHPDAVKAYRREYYAAHRQEAVEASRTWRAENPEQLLEQSRAWRAANSERQRDTDRKYREANLERLTRRAKAYRQAHPQLARERNKRRRDRKRGASVVQRINYDAVYARDGGACGICGGPVERVGAHFDHVVPVVLGGAHAEWNLQVAHPRCNLSKGARLPEQQLRFFV